MVKIEKISPYLYYFGKIQKEYTKLINREFHEYNINKGDLPFLFSLSSNKYLTQKELAEKLNYNEATVTRAIKRLENKGFIERKEDKKDKRKKNIVLTEKGEYVTKETMQKLEKIENIILNEFDSEEQKEFLKYLIKYYNIIETKVTEK